MPNVQQPEMRRSGKDPLVQDSAENKADSSLGGGDAVPGPVPRTSNRPTARSQPPNASRTSESPTTMEDR